MVERTGERYYTISYLAHEREKSQFHEREVTGVVQRYKGTQ